ncbi:MAG: hypothetical protein IKW39_04685 [Alphaproteobacteria bacterium]|nr:hypothetical protein [Alphaproteobacteria bacterium]
MSKKSTNLEKNTLSLKTNKWVNYILIALILEGIAIGSAYLISESKTKIQTEQLDYLSELLNEQNNRVKLLEQLPSSVSILSSSIAQNNGNIKLLEENFNILKNEVGNKKVEIISQKIENLSQRVESVEENKSTESLILSIALLIKENAIYGRGYLFEANILEEMAKNQASLYESIATIKQLNDKPILTDDILYRNFLAFAPDFNFDKKEEVKKEISPNESKVSKSIKLIKETVAGINFDKVVIMKKDSKTDEQKQLLGKLENLVKLYHFEQALKLIDANPIFFNSENKQFNEWFEDVKVKVSFDKAISKIISSELNVLRENINNKTLSLPETDVKN